MAVRHQYDMLEAFRVRGGARLQAMEERNQDTLARDAPITKAMKETKQIIKILDGALNRPLPDRSLTDLNRGFCEPCRALFDGAGDQATSLPGEDAAGLYYWHWDGYSLSRSAGDGCDFCLLLWRNHRQVRSLLPECEDMLARFDLGRYVNSDSIFALRFYHYVRTLHEGEMTLLQLPVLTVTLQEADSELCLRSILSSRLTPQALDATLGLSETPISTSTGSPESLGQIARWLELCDKSHSCCKKNRVIKPGFLPTRLVYVGSTSESSDIHLVDSKGLPCASRYATLSHCWGTSTSAHCARLSRDILPTFKEQIPLKILPKTFLDVTGVIRTLGIEYIWIDSLCIIQDSEEDWKREASMMWEVYSNSDLNISATGSSEPSEGLFRDRNPQTTLPCTVRAAKDHPHLKGKEYICYLDDEWLRFVEHTPVNARAWVFQERLLSPRICHFSEDQLFWECHELNASETFPKGIPSRWEAGSERQLLRSGLGSEDPRKMLEIWHSIVATYSEGALTYKSDKLIAVSALARQISTYNPVAGQYLAGLWKDQLVRQLLWYPASEGTRASPYRAPSWSWASMDGPISPNFDWSGYGVDGCRFCSRPLVKILEARIETGDDAFGAATAGMLRISGPLLEAQLTLESPREDPTSMTVEERKADLARIMGQVNPEYKEGNVVSVAISDGNVPNAINMDIDVVNGVLATDDLESAPRSNIWPPSEREFEVSFGQHMAKVSLDQRFDTDAEKSKILFFMPILCFSEIDRVANSEDIEIESIKGLILASTSDRVGQFERMGICQLDEYSAAEFFCNLGNQDESKLGCGAISQETIKLDEIVPERWCGKQLKFLPREFVCYEIGII